jgi:hypothetical protein
MNVNDDRERTGAGGQIEVTLELDAVVSSVGQVVMDLARRLGHGFSPKAQASIGYRQCHWISIGAADLP